ncbi:uncharacterized protein LOC141805006 isoform X2 [Halichoeres trimaculatus]|uniref:uncharacterized protein LOC141805006 isoform X2 n=1 Tax=Halichoeres trimaculatus TaxID=147232 RepID=UPI003D9E8B71
MTLLTNTLNLEKLKHELSVIMESVVEATVTELRRLLDLCSAKTTSATDPSHPALQMKTTTVGHEKQERQVISPEDRPQLCHELTDQFANLMAAWTKEAAEKILTIFKVSLCEAEDSAVLNDQTQQSVKPKAAKAGPVADAKKRLSTYCHMIKERPAYESDHSYHRVDASSENDSGSKPEVIPPEPNSELESSLKVDVVQGETQTSSNSYKKKTAEPFKCPSCDKLFTRKCMMERHYLTHSKPHLCAKCGRRFSVLRGLHAHLRRHTGEKLYKCSECGTEFAHKSSYVRHMSRHSLMTQTCTLCESSFIGVLALQRHRCTALKKTFICSVCPETFDCRQSLADHENQHTGSRDFVCEMCGDSFLSSLSLGTHRVTHLQKENCCDTLGLGSSDLNVLKSHLSKHTRKKLFTCGVCGKGCSHQSALKHHMLTHTGERPYVCETCGKRCGHASALQNHMKIHTGKKLGQQPVCDICGKKFRRMVSLKYHMNAHTGVKPFACDQCEKTFSNPSNMKVHMMIHTKVKRYGCIVCGRRFAQANGLKQHRRLHTGEVRYSCQVCGKEYMNSGDFKRHLEVHCSQESVEGQRKKELQKSETLNFTL